MKEEKNHELMKEQKIEKNSIKTNYSSREDEIFDIGRELTIPPRIKALKRKTLNRT